MHNANVCTQVDTSPQTLLRSQSVLTAVLTVHSLQIPQTAIVVDLVFISISGVHKLRESKFVCSQIETKWLMWIFLKSQASRLFNFLQIKGR